VFALGAESVAKRTSRYAVPATDEVALSVAVVEVIEEIELLVITGVVTAQEFVFPVSPAAFNTFWVNWVKMFPQ
jgi:hypothetical protein